MKNFRSNKQLTDCVDAYFKYIEGEYHNESKQTKADNGKTSTKQEKVWDRLPEPPTLTGLALFLGCDSLADYERYELNGRHKYALRPIRLRILAEYEKKLHQSSAYGAIFALKCMGFHEKPLVKADEDVHNSLKVEIIESGPKPAGSEKEVTL